MEVDSQVSGAESGTPAISGQAGQEPSESKPPTIDLETVSSVTKEPEPPAPIPEEPFVPEEEPAQKTWLGTIFPSFHSSKLDLLFSLEITNIIIVVDDDCCCLGPVVYSLQMMLPDFTNHVGCYIDVIIAADYLTADNTGVTSKALWGSHIYTDDSDVVAGNLIILTRNTIFNYSLKIFLFSFFLKCSPCTQ
jgi:hypothetical protein